MACDTNGVKNSLKNGFRTFAMVDKDDEGSFHEETLRLADVATEIERDGAPRSLMNVSPIKLARIVSVLGHPFLLMPLLTGIVSYKLLPPADALVAELIALGIVIIPSGVYTVVRVRQGRWSDLDVSDQRERSQFYGILLPLLFIIAGISWSADVPYAIPLGALAILMLVGSAFVLNSWVKVSLHSGFGIFAAEAFFFFNPILGGGVLLLAIFVGWSRIVLDRHSVREVIYSGLLGFLIGGLFLFSLYLFH